MQKNCIVCNKVFDAFKNTRYCSDECKKIGYQTKAHEYYCKKIKPSKSAKFKQLTSEPVRSGQSIRAEFSDLVAKGDKFARLMQCAKEQGNNCVEYWELFQEYQLEKGTGNCFVNGIEVHQDCFAELVLMTIQEHQHIIIQRS